MIFKRLFEKCHVEQKERVLVKLKKSKLLLFLFIYVFLVTSYIIFSSIWFFLHYFNQFDSLVLIEKGTGVIVPIIPLTRLALACFGFYGSCQLLRGYRKGLVLIMIWSILQIPLITFAFQDFNQTVVMGLAAFNAQGFICSWNTYESRSYYSTFTHFPSALTRGFGINFLGILLLLISFGIYLQNNEKIKEKLKFAYIKRLKKLHNIVSSSLVLALIVLILAPFVKDFHNRPKINLKVEKIELSKTIDYYFVESNATSNDNEHDIMSPTYQTVLLDIYVDIENLGKSDTTISKATLELFPCPKVSWEKVPIYIEIPVLTPASKVVTVKEVL